MDSNFCVISNNCWGAELYIERGIQYNTPFVGLFIPPIQFVKMVDNLPLYLKCKLVFIKETKFIEYEKLHAKNKYPIALLGDIEIHFMHYKDEDEASEKWIRRLSRMPQDSSNWFVKACDGEIINWKEYASLWNSIQYSKVFFSAKKRIDINNLVHIAESFNDYVTDGKALYKLSKDYFDVDKWINSKGELWCVKKISTKRYLKFLFVKLKYKKGKLW
ncbi:DUF1919 domain-containing protein [Flavobacterium galactosidilyticum]|uniref:DUF1919 domain-containing protein n=1 Tax=Flavobacterium galactosidilyticum TaxID=2893886 RepID=UPI001E4690D0|nr:DUF1919 domain-containing protein [Flavobacterium sp. F-340]UFH45646.1 DUF1919 domain-containing protein [Flavobacterium sp. F-340]